MLDFRDICSVSQWMSFKGYLCISKFKKIVNSYLKKLSFKKKYKYKLRACENLRLKKKYSFTKTNFNGK